MIVVDASATLSALLNAGPARSVFAREQLHAPQLLDFEVAAGLRRSVSVRHIEAAAGWNALYVLRRLGIKRYPVFPLLARVWELQENLSVYDASYIALAEFLGCSVLTADPRLAGAPGTRCPVTVVPR